VRRDVQADHGQVAVRHGQRSGRRDPAPPVLGAERVADLPQVYAGQDGGEYLKHPEQHSARSADRPEVAGESPVERVGKVHHEQEHAGGPAHVRAGGPPPGRWHPDQAREYHGGGSCYQVLPGRMEELPQDRRHRRSQHDRADHGPGSADVWPARFRCCGCAAAQAGTGPPSRAARPRFRPTTSPEATEASLPVCLRVRDHEIQGRTKAFIRRCGRRPTLLPAIPHIDRCLAPLSHGWERPSGWASRAKVLRPIDTRHGPFCLKAPLASIHRPILVDRFPVRFARGVSG